MFAESRLDRRAVTPERRFVITDGSHQQLFRMNEFVAQDCNRL